MSRGYWQDLLAFTNLIITGKAVIITKRDVDYEPRKIGNIDVYAISFEELVRLRADNIIEKSSWRRFYLGLPDDEARKKSIERFDVLTKEFQAQRRHEMKATHDQVSSNISALEQNGPKFVQFFKKVIEFFTQGIAAQ